jgi:hypothetical protein
MKFAVMELVSIVNKWFTFLLMEIGSTAVSSYITRVEAEFYIIYPMNA